MALDPKHDPRAHFVVKPLPSQVAAAKAKAAEAGGTLAADIGATPARPAADPFLRAANEDDDGYDPYSDRPARPEPLFQEDPWA